MIPRMVHIDRVTWEILREKAAEAEVSISELIRRAIRDQFKINR